MSAKRKPVIHPADPSLALVELTKGYFAIISAVDMDAVSAATWCSAIGGRYAVATINMRNVLLHRFIAARMGFPACKEVDHINGNGLDCRRSNLRPATRKQNMWNTRPSNSTNSGVKGVYRDKRVNKWYARIKANGVYHFLGSFDTIEEAAEARRVGALKYHGEFASERIQ